eukprot:scaffold643450_cov39-Prasinocladus_malaysianus.AAC.1
MDPNADSLYHHNRRRMARLGVDFPPRGKQTDQSLQQFLWDLVEMGGIAGPTALANLLEYLPVVTAMAVVGNLPGEQGK